MRPSTIRRRWLLPVKVALCVPPPPSPPPPLPPQPARKKLHRNRSPHWRRRRGSHGQGNTHVDRHCTCDRRRNCTPAVSRGFIGSAVLVRNLTGFDPEPSPIPASHVFSCAPRLCHVDLIPFGYGQIFPFWSRSCLPLRRPPPPNRAAPPTPRRRAKRRPRPARRRWSFISRKGRQIPAGRVAANGLPPKVSSTKARRSACGRFCPASASASSRSSFTRRAALAHRQQRWAACCASTR